MTHLDQKIISLFVLKPQLGAVDGFELGSTAGAMGSINVQVGAVFSGDVIGQLEGLGEMVEGVEEDKGHSMLGRFTGLGKLERQFGDHIGSSETGKTESCGLVESGYALDGPSEDLLGLSISQCSVGFVHFEI